MNAFDDAAVGARPRIPLPAAPASRTRAGAILGAAEWAAALAVLAGLVAHSLFLARHGYLHAPFYDAKGATFLDWFEPAWWSRRPAGAYGLWRSYYPPLSFVIASAATRGACYSGALAAARACDLSSVGVVFAAALAGAVVAFLAFRRAGAGRPLARTVVLCLGASMLYGLERGNLVLLAFPVWMLAGSDLIGRRWPRIAAAAFAINLKPYLLMVALGAIARRRWAGLAALAATGLSIYVLTWMVFGHGSPVELARDAITPLTIPGHASLDLVQFAASYASWLVVLFDGAGGPIRPSPALLQALRALILTVMALGIAGVFAAAIAAARRPKAVSTRLLGALWLSMMFTLCTPGGYSLIFLLGLVLLEPWRGAGRSLALAGALAWNLPWDISIVPLGAHSAFSFLAGGPVLQSETLTLGAFVRPAFVLMIEAGLTLAVFEDLRGAGRTEGESAR